MNRRTILFHWLSREASQASLLARVTMQHTLGRKEKALTLLKALRHRGINHEFILRSATVHS
jgi:hypothetical protein